MSNFQGSLATQESYGPKAGKGDTIGVIYNRAASSVSFVKNGMYLGVAKRNFVPEGEEQFLSCSGGRSMNVYNCVIRDGSDGHEYLYSMDDLIMEEEERHTTGNEEPYRFKERVSQGPRALGALRPVLFFVHRPVLPGECLGSVSHECYFIRSCQQRSLSLLRKN